MIIAEHCYFERISRIQASGKGVLFLDRDGVLIEDSGYVGQLSSVRILDGAAKLVRRANDLAIGVVIVTNQSGVARGLFNIADFIAVNALMRDKIRAESGGELDAIVACTAAPPNRGRGHQWRKPNAGMLLAARDYLGCCLHKSWMVGDRCTDVRAARRAGLAGAFHLSSSGTCGSFRRNGFEIRRSARLQDAMAILQQIDQGDT